MAAVLVGPERSVAQGIHFDVPEPEEVEVYSETLGDGRVDLVFPLPRSSDPLPAVIFVIGHPDDATSLGPLFEYPHYRDWARIVTGAGMVGVLYSVRDPVADLAQVTDFVASHGSRLGIDSERVALWSASANVPTALHYARTQHRLGARALVLYYGLMPTPDGFQDATYQTAGARSGFALPPYGPNQSYPDDLPFLVVRAGLDASTALLASIDQFIAYGLAENLNLRVLNYPQGQHSFDSRDDTAETRRVITETLDFLIAHLEPA